MNDETIIALAVLAVAVVGWAGAWLDYRRVKRAPLAGQTPLCIECHAAPAVNGGRCFRCRGRSML